MTLPDLGSSLPEVALRTALIYVFLVVLLRVAGKREVGQLSILDLVVLLVISDSVQNAMVGANSSLLGGVVAAATLVGLDRGLKLLSGRIAPLHEILEGEPRLLIRDGQLFTQAMREEGIEQAELLAAIRTHGLERPDDVHLAVLEINGSISIIPRGATQPAAAAGAASGEVS